MNQAFEIATPEVPLPIMLNLSISSPQVLLEQEFRRDQANPGCEDGDGRT